MSIQTWKDEFNTPVSIPLSTSRLAVDMALIEAERNFHIGLQKHNLEKHNITRSNQVLKSEGDVDIHFIPLMRPLCKKFTANTEVQEKVFCNGCPFYISLQRSCQEETIFNDLRKLRKNLSRRNKGAYGKEQVIRLTTIQAKKTY